MSATSQQVESLRYAEADKPMPDFTIRQIRHFRDTQAVLSDFKGKWLLLDFWNKYCGACIASFPHISEIQKQLGDSIQVMLVGIQDKEGQIEQIYEKYRTKEKLIMPCAFDSVLANRFDIYTAPHSILIDRNGVVRYITQSFSVEDIRRILAGDRVVLPGTYKRMHDDNSDDKESSSDSLYSFDSNKLFLVNNNGGNDTDFLYRSVLSQWNYTKHTQSIPDSINDDTSKGRFQALGVPLVWLYNYAYYGVGSWGATDSTRYGIYFLKPILKTKEADRFVYSYKYNKNIYSYSLSMPLKSNTTSKMMKKMQYDLDTYFGFRTEMQDRRCLYWKLVADRSSKSKVKAKSQKMSFHELIHTGFTARNWPFVKFTQWLESNNRYEVFINATKITGNVDMDLDCIPSDIGSINEALKKYGLKLVHARRKMRVLVIKDRD